MKSLKHCFNFCNKISSTLHGLHNKGCKREIAIFYPTLSPVSSGYSSLFVERMIWNIGNKLCIAFSCVYVALGCHLCTHKKYIEQSKRYNFQNKEFHCFFCTYTNVIDTTLIILFLLTNLEIRFSVIPSSEWQKEIHTKIAIDQQLDKMFCLPYKIKIFVCFVWFK